MPATRTQCRDYVEGLPSSFFFRLLRFSHRPARPVRLQHIAKGNTSRSLHQTTRHARCRSPPTLPVLLRERDAMRRRAAIRRRVVY